MASPAVIDGLCDCRRSEHLGPVQRSVPTTTSIRSSRAVRENGRGDASGGGDAEEAKAEGHGNGGGAGLHWSMNHGSRIRQLAARSLVRSRSSASRWQQPR